MTTVKSKYNAKMCAIDGEINNRDCSKPVKDIKNDVCAKNNCKKPATKRLVFTKLGFAARFCSECAISIQESDLAEEQEEKEHGG
jgi:hypothetical protein